MTKYDKFLILMVVTFSLGGMFFVKSITDNRNNLYLLIEVDGKEYKRISLDSSISKEAIIIDTQYGHNVIEIKDGSVKIIEADCKDHLCIKQGEISRANETNICLPNRVSIKIVANKSDLDIISY